jgi:hypothetical protein
MTMKKTDRTATSRRDSLRLLAAALAAPVLLPRRALAQSAAQDAPPPRAAAAETTAGAGGPWPSAEKLMQTNAENVALLKKVRLRNGDAPDQLPRPPLPGAQRKAGRR